MARPKKNTVTYFPHTVNHGKTLFIIEERFGNAGYAFWFKLLEILGSTENHVFRAGNPAEWLFLLAKTHVSEVTATEILDALASLNAIDRELWQEKTIWVQNFVNGVASVYANRRVETPTKPSFQGQKPRAVEVSTSGNRQSRVKESRVKEKKGEGEHPPEDESIPDPESDEDDIPGFPPKNPDNGRPKKAPDKILHGEFVKLAADQHAKLVKDYGATLTGEYIERLNDYAFQIGIKRAVQKYKSHFHTIRNWMRRDAITKRGAKMTEAFEIDPEMEEILK